MTRFVPTSHPLSPATAVIVNGFMNKVTILTGLEVRHKLSSMNFPLTKADLAITTAESLICQQQTLTPSP